MENGEKIVLALQFTLLFVVVLVIGNLIPPQFTLGESVNAVYWGQPAAGNEIPQSGSLQVNKNVSSIVAYLVLPSSGTPASASAGRVCTDPATKSGEVRTYDTVAFGYDQRHSQNYYVISPVGQQNGWSCTYTIALTDSHGQVTKWTGTVVLKQ